MKNEYSLPQLLSRLQIAKSGYYYQRLRRCFEVRHEHDYSAVAEVFHKNKRRYGYRRIKAELARIVRVISEKVIRRIMRDNGLAVIAVKARKYCSYPGKISHAAPDFIKRDFHASQPDVKWLTDITEFSISAGKAYLSPVTDCFDGMPVAWKIGVSPNAEPANMMLDRRRHAGPAG